MSQLIVEQARGFFIMFFCGIAIAMFRQLFLSLGRQKGIDGIIAPFTELLFWLLSSLITSSFIYYSSYGAITLYGVIGFTLGAFLCYNIPTIGTRSTR